MIAKCGLVCFLLIPTFAYSQEPILAVMSSNGKMYQGFLSKLEKKLHNNTTISQISFSEINNKTLNSYKIIIPVGYKAAKAVSKYKTNSTIIYSLIPDDESLQSNMLCKKTTCYKIYINQPINRYIQLFKILFPKGKTLAFSVTKEKSKKAQQVKIASENNSLIYKDIRIEKNKTITRTLIDKLNNDDVLLALPNPDIYNSNNAKSIILSTYHANVPIIAYSKSFAKAGALISLYSSIDNVADKTANVINATNKNGFLKQKEFYPDNFMIEINSSVARSLNMNIDSANIIKSKMK